MQRQTVLDSDADFDGSGMLSEVVCSYSAVSQCDQNAECDDNGNEYNCQCAQGYEGNGATCQGTKLIKKIIKMTPFYLGGPNFCTKFKPLNNFFKRRPLYHFKA